MTVIHKSKEEIIQLILKQNSKDLDQLFNVITNEGKRIYKEVYNYAFLTRNIRLFDILFLNDKINENLKIATVTSLYIHHFIGKHRSNENEILTLNTERDIFFKEYVEKRIFKINIIKSLITKNSICELGNYIKFNSYTFKTVSGEDLLIFSIKNNASFEFIKLIISHYENLNYFKYNSGYETPLSMALSMNKFDISNILLKNGASMNYKIHSVDIVGILFGKNLLNYKNFSYVINHGMILTPNLTTSVIEIDNHSLIKYYFDIYFFSKYRIINFLFSYKKHIPLSDYQIDNNICKRFITDSSYKKAFSNNNYYAIYELIRHDKRNFSFIYKEFPNEINIIGYHRLMNNLMDIMLKNFDILFKIFFNNECLFSDESLKKYENFICKCFSHKDFNTQYVNLDQCLFIIGNNDKNYSRAKLLIQSFFKHSTYKQSNINLYSCISVINSISSYSSNKLLEYFLNFLYNDPSFNASLINLNTYSCLINESLQNSTSNVLVKNMKKKYVMNMMMYVLSHPSFDFIVSFKNILKHHDNMYMETFQIMFEYLFDRKLFNHSISLEKIIILAIKYNDFPCVQWLMKLILKSKYSKIVNLEKINFEEVLLQAIKCNDITILKFLFSMLSNDNSYDFYHKINLKKLLLEVSKLKDTRIMASLLEQLLEISVSQEYTFLSIPSLNNYDSKSLSLLLNCLIKIGNLSIIKCLLENDELKFNINECDQNGEYPLLVAFHNYKNIENGIEIFKYCLDQKSDINVRDNRGILLMSMILQDHNFKLIKYILNRYQCHFSTNIEKQKISCNNLLIHYIYQNDLYQVKLCINNTVNEDLNFCFSMDGFNPLILSYLLKNHEIYQYLLNYFNINEVDRNGYSLLHYAIITEDVKTVEYLIEKGAKILYIENEKGLGHSAIDIVLNLQNTELNLVIQHKWENICNNENNNNKNEPLLISLLKSNIGTEHNKSKYIKYLIHKGCNVNVSDKYGKLALTYALESKSLPNVQILIENGADVNALNSNRENKNETALMYSIRLDDFNIFNYFTKLFINDSNIVDIQKMIIYRHQLKLLKILHLNNKLFFPKNYMNNPFTIAIKTRNSEIVKFIAEKYYDHIDVFKCIKLNDRCHNYDLDEIIYKNIQKILTDLH